MGFEAAGEADLGGDYAAYMKVNEDTSMELFLTDPALQKQEMEENGIGTRHIAFDVDDVDVWHRRLCEHGVKITLEPCNLDIIGKRVMLFQAPDNVIIELCMNMSE